MKKLLWLDDYRTPSKDWVRMFSPIGINVETHWVKNYKEFVQWITKKGLPDGICFDHDLGGDKSGFDCAKWLVSYCLERNIDIPPYGIQSANPVGKDNIHSLFKSYSKSLS